MRTANKARLASPAGKIKERAQLLILAGHSTVKRGKCSRLYSQHFISEGFFFVNNCLIWNVFNKSSSISLKRESHAQFIQGIQINAYAWELFPSYLEFEALGYRLLYLAFPKVFLIHILGTWWMFPLAFLLVNYEHLLIWNKAVWLCLCRAKPELIRHISQLFPVIPRDFAEPRPLTKCTFWLGMAGEAQVFSQCLV